MRAASRAVEDLRVVGAEIAIVAGLRQRFAEIGEQGLAAAMAGLGEAQERVQPLVVGLLARHRCRALVDLGAAQADVLGAVEREGLGRRAVAPGAADLLVIGLDRLRQVGMRDIADVGLVHAHAEGDGGADDQSVLALEPGFRQSALVALQTGVVGDRGVTGLPQGAGQRLGLGPARAIDDAGAAAAGMREVEDLPTGRILGAELKVEIRPVEAVQEGLGVAPAEEPPHDLGAGLGIGGGGQRHGLDAEARAQLADPEIIRAEVVAPLADAMGLVDGEQGDADAAQQRP